MATIVKEPLLHCKHSRRWRSIKFIAIFVFTFFLIALVSYLASGKSSRKLHKNIYALEDKLEDLQKSYKGTTLAFQRDIEALKLERKSFSAKQNQNNNSFEIEKTLYQQLNQTQQEVKEQNEAIRNLLKMFESYKAETTSELSELKNMRVNDQQEIKRLQNTINQLQAQRYESKVVNEKKEFNSSSSSSQTQAQAQVQAQVQPKDLLTRPSTPETKPKSSSNILARSAKAVKDYVSNLAYKLNPFRSSRDKTSNNRPTYKENTGNLSIALEGTIQKSLEGVKSEGSQSEKNITWLTKDIDMTLENLVSLLNTAESLDNPAEILKRIESKFHHLEIVMADYVERKNNGKDHEKALKWRKNYIPIKEHFEKIKHENAIHGSKSHNHSSKSLHKLTNMTRNLKDTLHSLI